MQVYKNATGAKIGRIYPAGIVEHKINAYSIMMQSQDISKWKNAINMAWSTINPDRRQLIEMFESLILDGHTESVIEKRITAITNRKVDFFLKNQDGDTPDNIRDFITEAPWFQSFIKESMMAIPYGFSLIELVPKNGLVDMVKSLNRQHVIPEWSMLVWDKYKRDTGINYLTDPKLSKYLVFVGEQKSYGKLMTAAQYIIYKRGGLADWAQFAELYGMPIKHGKYDPFDEKSRILLGDALANMGANTHIVTPKNSDLELLDTTTQGKAEIYRDLIEVCNAEISKIFVGQTLTTEAGNRGARSLGDIHKEVEENLNLADCIRMEYLLNWELTDKLRGIGYEIPDGRFVFPQTVELPLSERIKVDVLVADQVAISDEYWYNTYGVEKGDLDEFKRKKALDEERDQKIQDKIQEQEERDQLDGKKKKPTKKDLKDPKEEDLEGQMAKAMSDLIANMSTMSERERVAFLQEHGKKPARG